VVDFVFVLIITIRMISWARKNAFDNENPSVRVSVFILIAMWGQQFRSSHIPASMFVDKPMFARLVWSGLPGQTDASAL